VWPGAQAVWKPPKKGTEQTARLNYGSLCNHTDATHLDCPNATINAARLAAAAWRKVEALLLAEVITRREVARLRSADPTADELRAIDRALAQARSRQAKPARAVLALDDAAEPEVGSSPSSMRRRWNWSVSRSWSSPDRRPGPRPSGSSTKSRAGGRGWPTISAI
jgi:hypothetical protein